MREKDVTGIKAEVLKITGIDENVIDCFTIYGELMCNKGRYNYTQNKLDGTYQLFGGMIKPASPEVINEIAQKLGEAKFACKINKAKEGEEEAVDLVMIVMNPAFKSLIEKHEYPLVPLVHCDNLYEMVLNNYDWMFNGHGEGLVIVGPETGSNANICKWKIGVESGGGGRFARELLAILEGAINDADKLFGDNSEKAKELFTKMIEVEKSIMKDGVEQE